MFNYFLQERDKWLYLLLYCNKFFKKTSRIKGLPTYRTSIGCTSGFLNLGYAATNPSTYLIYMLIHLYISIRGHEQIYLDFSLKGCSA